MKLAGSITRDMLDLEKGERRDEAARGLWDCFFDDLVDYALKKLHAMHADRGSEDEEDAVARALAKVLWGIERGQLRPRNRAELRKVLIWITRREAIRQVKRHRPVTRYDVELEADERLTSEAIVREEEEFRWLLDLLEGDDALREIALCKLAGDTNEEIARSRNCSLATVERKLKRIRDRWSGALRVGSAKPGPRSVRGEYVA